MKIERFVGASLMVVGSTVTRKTKSMFGHIFPHGRTQLTLVGFLVIEEFAGCKLEFAKFLAGELTVGPFTFP